MTRQIAILGSTGSIGKNALRVISSLGPEYQVQALSAHSNVDLLAEQARDYGAKVICVTNESHVSKLVEMVEDLDDMAYELKEEIPALQKLKWL